jgi:hypothetical protein
MFIHVFGFRWNADATDADKTRARKEILAFRNVIPGLVAVNVGRNLSQRAQGYEFCGLMTFTSKDAFDAYCPHPAHLALLEWLRPLIDPIELDFDA